MKIKIKRQVLEAVASIEECHEIIRSIKDKEQSLDLLGLCQDLAISVGETLEAQESLIDVVQRIIEQLEEYYKNIYKLGCVEELQSKEYSNLLNICSSNIKDIKSVIESDIPEQKQVVVFLPYIASMWDSLASICHEAMKNEDWEAYVMPVPYYSFDKQRKPISDTCEYDMFPQDLPLVHYKTRTLESLKPDLIFYHNPYDDINLITCVHPEFFSTNLKKITPYLVYVPYYFATENSMEHMPDMPGVKNAWRVIVQEEVAAQYLKKYQEEKVIGLGSPKLDALFNANTKNIPEEWQKKIENKTVLLFNTHLKSVMNEPTKFFDMLDYVMDIMGDDQDIVVIWRPHPLIQQTLTSLQNNKELLRQYKRRVDKFKLLKNGIYDDSADLHRSITLSHGYIGSFKSSVFTLYKETDKPIYILPDTYEKNWWETRLININSGGVIAGGYVWQFGISFNAIIKYNPVTKQAWYVASLAKFPMFEPNLFYTIAICNDWLVLVPRFRNCVVLYNIVSSDIKYIEIEKEDFAKPQWFTSYVNEDEVIVVRKDSTDYHYVISTEDFSCNKINLKEKETYLSAADGYIWTHQKLHNKLVARNAGNCLTFDLPNNYSFEIVPHICISQNSLWVVSRKEGKLLYWKDIKDFQNCNVINIFDKSKTGEEIFIRLCNVHDGRLLFSTTYSDALYSLDISTMTCKQLTPKTMNVFTTCSIDALLFDNEIYVLPHGFENNIVSVVDLKHQNVSQHRITIENHDRVQELFRCELKGTGKDAFAPYLPLSPTTWIETVKAIDENTNRNCSEKKVGIAIWKQIESEL